MFLIVKQLSEDAVMCSTQHDIKLRNATLSLSMKNVLCTDKKLLVKFDALTRVFLKNLSVKSLGS